MSNNVDQPNYPDPPSVYPTTPNSDEYKNLKAQSFLELSKSLRVICDAMEGKEIFESLFIDTFFAYVLFGKLADPEHPMFNTFTGTGLGPVDFSVLRESMRTLSQELISCNAVAGYKDGTLKVDPTLDVKETIEKAVSTFNTIDNA